MTKFNWDEYDYCEDEFEDEFEDDEFDCGFISGEGCPLIGTEDCDFECPYRNRLTSHPGFPYLEILENEIIIPAR
ncbi:hypothetical protein [Halotia branconii]|uniref:Uncharacterized protein n=1 Tax=Halotia branconii CENA392 TaxID=1539056 RepID=A0AAJ6NQB3_9CYAN|nr:hypothetical protein [Halotia branconii]WGV24763.1 hypothetical protein QI031_23815 [Halotia branconii CENA392]